MEGKRRATMEIDSDLLKLLMEIGFLATDQGRLKEAGAIFEGVAKARPNSAYPRIGLGCVAMGLGEFDRAIELLNAAPAKDDGERDLSLGFLGMALKLAGRNDESRIVLSRLLDNGGNEAAVRMAGRLLEKF